MSRSCEVLTFENEKGGISGGSSEKLVHPIKQIVLNHSLRHGATLSEAEINILVDQRLRNLQEI